MVGRSLRSFIVIGIFAFVLAPSVQAEGDPVAPDAPWGLVALPQLDEGVLLSWQPPINDGGAPVTEYRIYRAVLPNALSLLGVSTATTFTDAGHSDPNSYFSVPLGSVVSYQVTAVTAAGEGSASNFAFIVGGPCIDTMPEFPFVFIEPECFIHRPWVVTWR